MSLEEHLAEYRKHLDGEFVCAVEAGRFVDMMRAEHPDELDEWLTARALSFVSRALSQADRKERRSAMARFSDAAQEFSVTGDADTFVPLFKAKFAVNAEDLRRPLGEMTGIDCRFAATTFNRQGNRLMAVGAFLDALAKQAKGQRVSDVMDEPTCERLLRSFLGGTDAGLDALGLAA